jgi:hypothetical protein
MDTFMGDTVSVLEGPVSNCVTGKIFCYQRTDKEKSIDFLNSSITITSLNVPAVSLIQPLRCCNS